MPLLSINARHAPLMHQRRDNKNGTYDVLFAGNGSLWLETAVPHDLLQPPAAARAKTPRTSSSRATFESLDL